MLLKRVNNFDVLVVLLQLINIRASSSFPSLSHRRPLSLMALPPQKKKGVGISSGFSHPEKLCTLVRGDDGSR